jgi:hypothetical protein
MIDEGEFNKRVAKHKANRWMHNRINNLFESITEE